MSWLSGWQYRKSHTINPAAGAGTDYQKRITVHHGFGYDSGDNVYLNNGYYGSTFKYSIPTADHSNFGLGYPVTMKFLLPESSSGLKVYSKHLLSDAWVQITEKTSAELYNAIEAVRFDYDNDYAYVSVVFSDASDDVYIYFTDSVDDPFTVYYNGIAKYYDNRESACVITLDEWDDCSTPYDYGLVSKYGAGARIVCDALTARHLWASMGIVTRGRDFGGEPVWADIQGKIDAGYIEISSHSQSHPHIPYVDYDVQIGGSRDDIVENLTLPDYQRKGVSQYVANWQEPFGNSNATLRTKLKYYNYLIARCTYNTSANFEDWDETEEMYDETNPSITMGMDGIRVVATLNAKFDEYHAAGKIYHLFCHTADTITPGDWGMDLTPGSYAYQHFDYIKEKTDVWYAGLGALYMYHYVQERGIVSVIGENHKTRSKTDFSDIRFTASDALTTLRYWIEEYFTSDYANIWLKITDDISTVGADIYVYYGKDSATDQSDGDNTFIFFDDFIGSVLDTDKWYSRGDDPQIDDGLVLTSTYPESQWKSVCYGNGIFVAVTDATYAPNFVMTSEDGIIWIGRTGVVGLWQEVCYGNGIFVAVGISGTNKVMYSANGIDWTGVNCGLDQAWISICWSDTVGLFVAVASSGTGNRVMTSPDGINWTSRTSAADNTWQSVCYGGGLYVAVASDGTYRSMYSANGIDWALTASSINYGAASVCWSSELSLFVLVTSNGGAVGPVYSSTDGMSWTEKAIAGANGAWKSVIWDSVNGLFVAVGSLATHSVMYSSNGTSWICISPIYNNWQSVCYGEGLFVAVSIEGDMNRVMTSPDAINWTGRKCPPYHALIDGKISSLYTAIHSRIFGQSAMGWTLSGMRGINNTWDNFVETEGSNTVGCIMGRVCKNGSQSYVLDLIAHTYKEYFVYKTLWTASAVKIYQNDDLKSTIVSANIPTTELVPVFKEYTSSEVLYVSWVFVRNYVSPEPVNGVWGAEESGGSGFVPKMVMIM